VTDPLLDDPAVRCDVFSNIAGGAVRLTHTPSGRTAYYQYSRGQSQIEAKERAAALLRARLPFPDAPAEGCTLVSTGSDDCSWQLRRPRHEQQRQLQGSRSCR
jgi:hypothetical protein